MIQEKKSLGFFCVPASVHIQGCEHRQWWSVPLRRGPFFRGEKLCTLDWNMPAGGGFVTWVLGSWVQWSFTSTTCSRSRTESAWLPNQWGTDTPSGDKSLLIKEYICDLNTTIMVWHLSGSNAQAIPSRLDYYRSSMPSWIMQIRCFSPCMEAKPFWHENTLAMTYWMAWNMCPPVSLCRLASPSHLIN